MYLVVIINWVHRRAVQGAAARRPRLPRQHSLGRRQRRAPREQHHHARARLGQAAGAEASCPPGTTPCPIPPIKGLLIDWFLPIFTDFSDFLGRLQPSKTTIQKTPGTLGVEDSSAPWKVLRFIILILCNTFYYFAIFSHFFTHFTLFECVWFFFNVLNVERTNSASRSTMRAMKR